MILILGKTGYVSKRYQDFFDSRGIIYDTVSIRGLTSPYSIESIIKTKLPDLVINCTGYTGTPNIEACEINKEECLFVNVVLAGIVADSCNHLGIPLAHISTGCIYKENDPSWWHMFTEEDTPNFSFAYGNASWYSGTKALGEELVRKSWDRSYIWRIRMPFNHIDDRKNLITKFLKYPKLLRAANSYTNLDEFVHNSYYSVVRNAPYGIYNMVNPGSLDARDILDIGRKYGVTTREYEYLTDQEFDKISSAPRSKCVLDTSKIEQYTPFLPIAQSFSRAFKFWNQGDTTPFWK